MPSWYVRLTGDEPKGPYTTEAIADRVIAGALPRDAPVCPVGDERWFPLETLPEFVLALKEAAARPPRSRSNPPGSVRSPYPPGPLPGGAGTAAMGQLPAGALGQAPLPRDLTASLGT